MISPNTTEEHFRNRLDKVMTAIFLLSRHWPIQQIKSGKASEIVKVSLERLNKEELEVVKEYEQTGSLLHYGK